MLGCLLAAPFSILREDRDTGHAKHAKCQRDLLATNFYLAVGKAHRPSCSRCQPCGVAENLPWAGILVGHSLVLWPQSVGVRPVSPGPHLRHEHGQCDSSRVLWQGRDGAGNLASAVVPLASPGAHGGTKEGI